MKTERAGKEKCFVNAFFTSFLHLFPPSFVPEGSDIFVQTITVIRRSHHQQLADSRSWYWLNDSDFFVPGAAACGRLVIGCTQSTLSYHNVMWNVGTGQRKSLTGNTGNGEIIESHESINILLSLP